jgi:hypothetical protein
VFELFGLNDCKFFHDETPQAPPPSPDAPRADSSSGDQRAEGY